MSNPNLEPAVEALHSDPRYVAGMANLDQPRWRQLTTQMERDLAIGVSFHNRLEDASRAKARAGKSDPQTESLLVQMGNQAITALKDARVAMDEATTMLVETGLEEVLNEHLPTIYKNFDNSPSIQSQLVHVRGLGVRDESLRCVHDEIAKDDFNVLRLRGADGTISGLVRSAGFADLENLVEVIQSSGLPTIRGRGGDPFDWIAYLILLTVLIGLA